MIQKIKSKVNQLKINRYITKYEENLQKRIKNSDFTILASNCAAGIIYNRLGMKFLSPTINMWFKQEDFIKFCTNLEHYVSTELEFVELADFNFPTAKLGDIYLYFNHSKTQEEAKESWDKRKKRINYDNLYILMYDRGNLPKEEYLKLNKVKCKNKIVFTNNKDFDVDFAYYIKPNLEKENGDSYLDRDEMTLTTLEKKWDFVKWLNCEE